MTAPKVSSAGSDVGPGPRPQRWVRNVRGSHVLIALTVVTLLAGWHRTWPDLNRDFDHLHGWEHAQDAQLARVFVEEGVAHLGFAPAAYYLYDAGEHYRYFFHYSPLPHFLISLVLRAAPNGYDHVALRLAGMVVTAAFLLFLYFLGRRLRGPPLGAWLLFFAAVNAEIFFFGVFPAMYVQGSLFVAVAYWSYVRWRSDQRALWSALSVAGLVGAFLSWTGFYSAAAPILVDLVLYDPSHRGRRRWRRVALVGALPVLVFIAVQLQYRFGVRLLTGKEVWASDFRANLAARGHYWLLRTPGFYKQLIWDSLRWASPVAVIGVGVYVVVRARWGLRLASASRAKPPWQTVFVASGLALVLFLLVFPQSTLDHEFEYFQLIIPLALAAAFLVAERSPLLKVAAVAVTMAVAFGATESFAARNNTPETEFQTGVAIRLATPPDSFVRVPLPGTDFYAMLLYYSHRGLLFNVPDRFRPVVAANRFAVAFGRSFVPGDTEAVYVGGAKSVILDHAPGSRPQLPSVRRSYERGAWSVLGAGVTGSYDDWRLVEIAWESTQPTSEPLAIEIGQWSKGAWSTLLTAALRGNTLDASQVRPGDYRDGYLVKASPGARVAFRVFDRASGQYRDSDNGELEIPATAAPGTAS